MKRLVTLPIILLFICGSLMVNNCSNGTNKLPFVFINRPWEYSSYFLGDKIDFVISACDMDGTITQVEILMDGSSIALFNYDPSNPNIYKFSYEVKNMQPGEHNIEAIGTDDQGEQKSSERIIKVLSDLEEYIDPRDGHIYRYVTIGSQTWMADNLAFLPEVNLPTEISDSIPRYYVYGYDGNDVSTAKQTEYYSKYGVLYNWEAAKQACPEGWHLPSFSEWEGLEVQTHTELMHTNEGGCNAYGFSGIFAGEYVPYLEGETSIEESGFKKIEIVAGWWSSTRVDDSFYPWWLWTTGCSISFTVEKVDDDIIAWRYPEYPSYGYSVRCVKDESQ